LKVDKLIAKEGFPFIITAVIAFLLILVINKVVLLSVIFIMIIFFFIFFRDPERHPPVFDKIAVSGADGRIVEIIEENYEGEDFIKVSVFMNVFNVHVNRMPIKGKIIDIKHKAGKFLPADKPESSMENEQNIFTVETEYGTVIIKQVAGLVARRTVSYVEKGESLNIGDRLGMIKFSSRVDHYFPKNFEIVVDIDDKVIAGETVIARVGD
jgi:phosphatidylserine decarboxylase